MATRKSAAKRSARTNPKGPKNAGRQSQSAKGTTASGPSHPDAPTTPMAVHAAEQAALADAMPFNSVKANEYAPADATRPPEGPHQPMPSPLTGASSVSEANKSAKTGAATTEPQALDGALAAKRVNSGGQTLTTN